MKKLILTTIFLLSVMTFTGCNSAKIDELNDKVIQLENERDKLQQELQQEKDKSEEINSVVQKLESEIQEEKSKFDILIDDIRLDSEEVYKDGINEGSIYGKFDVVVKVANRTEKDLKNVKVSVKMETSLDNYTKSLNIKTDKVVNVESLKPLEEKEIVITGFSVDHPEMVQELIVNVIGYGEIKKIKIPSVFPPGSQD